MPLLIANAPVAEGPPDPEWLLARYAAHQGVTGREHPAADRGARAFLRAWPDPAAWAAQPLHQRAAASPVTVRFVMFLTVHRLLQPGWDWLVDRKLTGFWRECRRAVNFPRGDHRKSLVDRVWEGVG